MPRVQLPNTRVRLGDEPEYDEIEIVEEKARRTKHGVPDGRALRRTGRTVEINFKARLDTLVEIRRLGLRDSLKMGEVLGRALESYKAAWPERGGSSEQGELQLE